MRVEHENVDPAEVAKFQALAARWWDEAGDFKPLHDINPLRLGFIEERVALEGKTVLDVGCGGGLLAEAMARAGAQVTGIDVADASLSVAKLHLKESGLSVDYRSTNAEKLADSQPAAFDLVTCLEVLEHVPDPGAIVRACHTLARPGGQVVFSTINRNPKAYLFAIVGAEYLLNMLPRGTHEYAKFIRPSELERWGREAGLAFEDMTGLHYNPITRRYSLGDNVDVNYLMAFSRPAA